MDLSYQYEVAWWHCNRPIFYRCIRSSFFGINSLLIEFFGYIDFNVAAISQLGFPNDTDKMAPLSLGSDWRNIYETQPELVFIGKSSPHRLIKYFHFKSRSRKSSMQLKWPLNKKCSFSIWNWSICKCPKWNWCTWTRSVQVDQFPPHNFGLCWKVKSSKNLLLSLKSVCK